MFLALLPLVFILIYIYATKNQMYWAKKGVKHDTPLPFVGNHLKNLLGLRNDTQTGIEYYRRYSGEKFVGYYRGTTPEIIIRDPDLIKSIMNTDFEHATMRGFGKFSKSEPLALSLYMATESMRSTLKKHLPGAFTTSRLRSMLPKLVQCGKSIETFADALARNGRIVNVYDLMERFTAQYLNAVVFGIETNEIVDENRSETTDLICRASKHDLITKAIRELFPDAKTLQDLLVVQRQSKAEFFEFVRKTCELRKQKVNTEKSDLTDFLMDLQASGKLSFEGKLDTDVLASQVYILFAAGFKTSTLAMSYTLHNLAQHPDVLQKVQAEIDMVFADSNHELTFEAISKFQYLDNAVKESMRLLTPGAVYHRQCTKKYTIPGTQVTIDPGVRILIPVQAIHLDGQYYEDPLEFNPARFATNIGKERHSHVYLPFGEGPRKCLGDRLARMMVTGALAMLLKRFSVCPSQNSKEPTLKTNVFLAHEVAGLPLKIVNRQTVY